MKPTHFVRALVAGATLLAASAASAQAWQNKPIRIAELASSIATLVSDGSVGVTVSSNDWREPKIF